MTTRPEPEPPRRFRRGGTDPNAVAGRIFDFAPE